MSTVWQKKCDQCDKIQEQKTGKERTPYDPDFRWGWLSVHGATSVWDMDGNSDQDFCSIGCLLLWTQERWNEWNNL